MRKFGLIGKRLDYSFSLGFFEGFFQKNEIDATYENIELDELALFFESDQWKSFSGFSVTIPYKEQIIPFLDELSDDAKEIGAVNTILIRDGKKIGHNTDAFGFKQSIKPFLTNQHEKALILGTGGASKAVEFVLKEIGIQVLFASRNPGENHQFSYAEINQNMVNACKLIVNTTPIGTFPALEEKPDFPTEFLSTAHFVVDLIYNPEQTRLLRESAEKGAITLNGLSMLREQAMQSWKIWNT
jgi:shikimate dehydrogenase